ncbi:hypothetical protein BDQ12DRAFT_619331 [Crucibulum laeve]|uniref:Uncharacterized protein n=1 Tax=Crucibulum laeve TaxID=68775 RepID=A0A5C3LEN5_9AGAR|nr:hypothetical protein BDQ12DRAFT_619331 [Crucibulum laeve]
MCPNSCVAYTGPFSELDKCPICKEDQYNAKGSWQYFTTIPLGPQLQALWRSPESAHKMSHWSDQTDQIFEQLERNGGSILAYNDIYHGTAYLEAVANGQITDNDMVLMFSMDGAQLYYHKESDC